MSLRHLVLSAALMLIAFAAACSTVMPSPAPLSPGEIIIDPADQACQAADECVLVSTHCSDCECGTPVNIAHRDKYLNRYRFVCADYRGPVCEMMCPPAELQCLDHRCVSVEPTAVP